MQVVNLNPDEWANLVRTAPNATIFHTDEWLRILERTYSVPIQRLGFVEGGDLLGGIPVLVQRKAIFRIAGSPQRHTVTPYQGIIYRDAADYRRLFEAFWNHAKSAAWDFVELTSPPGSPSLDSTLVPRGLRPETRRTICVDLSMGEAQLYRKMRKGARGEITQAEKRGTVIEVVDPCSDDWIGPYYRMSVEKYRRKGRPSAIPKAYFQNVVAILGPSGKVRLVFAKYEGQVVAAGIFLADRGNVYFWDGVFRREYHHLRGNTLIHWDVMRWGCAQGFVNYDLAGAGIQSIAGFKKGFGGVVVEHPAFLWTRGWLAQLGERGYRLLAPTVRWALSLLPERSGD
jgi:CelD/BcsL family acetyltransferase involved in cellulose biosynthesis